MHYSMSLKEQARVGCLAVLWHLPLTLVARLPLVQIDHPLSRLAMYVALT